MRLFFRTPLAIILAIFSLSFAQAADEPKPFRHVVCLKFKEGTSAEEIAAIEKGFVGLKDTIDTITDLEWGPNENKGKNAQGFTHCFIVTFADKAGLDVYLPHAAHQAFVVELKKVLEDVFVADFVVQ